MPGRIKEGNEVKEGIYAKVEAHISGDYFPIACRYWNCEIRNANRKLGMVTACIGIFFILQSLTKKYNREDSSPLKRRAILLCFFFSSFVFQ